LAITVKDMAGLAALYAVGGGGAIAARLNRYEPSRFAYFQKKQSGTLRLPLPKSRQSKFGVNFPHFI